jgi:hypothetical protein
LADLSDHPDSDADLSVLLLAVHEFVWLLSLRRDRLNPSGDAMGAIHLPSKALTGVSFSLCELILIRRWSEANGLRMVIRLDHGSDEEDYEEVLAFHLGDSALCCWIMWRSVQMVFVQPLIGRARQYASVAEAFEDSTAKQPIVVADVKPACWPDQRMSRLPDQDKDQSILRNPFYRQG